MNCTCDIPDESNGNCAIPGEEHGGAEGPSVPETQFISLISVPETQVAMQGDRKVRVVPETQISQPQVITEEPDIRECAIPDKSLLSEANSEQSNFFIYF